MSSKDDKEDVKPQKRQYRRNNSLRAFTGVKTNLLHVVEEESDEYNQISDRRHHKDRLELMN